MAMQSSVNWFTRYRAQLYCTPSLVVSTSSIVSPDTWFGRHFRNNQLANSWIVNHRGLSSICVALYACPPLIKLYLFISYAAIFLSWSFPTKCVARSTPVLLKPMIQWIRSIVISTLWSNHSCPPCMQDNSTFTIMFISLLHPNGESIANLVAQMAIARLSKSTVSMLLPSWRGW